MQRGARTVVAIIRCHSKESVDRILSPMHHIQGCDRNQTLLLPNSVDEYIGPDNPVRFVDAFVEQLDLQGAGFFRFAEALHLWLFESRTF